MRGPICVLLILCGAASLQAESRLVVHEWGTFTSLQDEEGKSVSGINTDDEPVPKFVHRFEQFLLLPTEAPALCFQGVPSCHPDVTMRLETPVIYFHPPADWRAQPVQVSVGFRGGWITEYFPDGRNEAPGLDPRAPTKTFVATADALRTLGGFSKAPA